MCTNVQLLFTTGFYKTYVVLVGRGYCNGITTLSSLILHNINTSTVAPRSNNTQTIWYFNDCLIISVKSMVNGDITHLLYEAHGRLRRGS